MQPGEYKVYTNQNIPHGVVLTPPPTPPTPSGTKLMVQANPNPFGTAGIIKYIVPSTGVVNIVLLNSLGQKVQHILSATKSSGEYEIPVSGIFKVLAKGAYYLRIEQNGEIKNTRFVKL
ncbi:MAG: T9SS type A sorting domain-containing protein [Chitinophagaceae bacterium]|nr:T9SS type A sorting domain-containing protein [Chitinophagaceae bacterium]